MNNINYISHIMFFIIKYVTNRASVGTKLIFRESRIVYFDSLILRH